MRGRAFLVTAGCVLLAGPAPARVLTGSIDRLPETIQRFYWGDGVNDLYSTWSVRDVNSTGWFYGTASPWSNADVYVYTGLTDPTTISDATIYAYTSGSASAGEGDTVFFRGANGYYGAWRIDDIYDSGLGHIPYAYLDGRWYFQTDGTGNFTPAPSTVILVSAGMLAVLRRRR